MGGQQLAGVMQMIQVKSGRSTLEEAKAGAEILTKMVDEQSSAFYATGQLWDDGVIEPSKTREYLGMGLAIINRSKIEGTGKYGIFRM